MATIVNNTVFIAILKAAKRVDLESFHHKKKNYNYVWGWMLLAYCGDHFIIYTNIASSCCIPETTLSQLYANLKKVLRQKQIMEERQEGHHDCCRHWRFDAVRAV